MEWLHAAADQIFAWLRDLGYFGILIGLMIEIIPSEIVLSYGGFLVSQGSITFTGAVIFGTIGGTLAQIFLYWIGKYGGRPFLDKYGKYLLIHQKHLDLSEKWFDKYGTGIIFTARFVPVVRHAISIPAGIVKMSFWKFTVLTALAVIPWSVFFIYIGKALGENWQQMDEIAGTYAVPFIIIAILLTILYFLYKTRKPKKEEISGGLKEDSSASAEGLELGPEYHVFHHCSVYAGPSKQLFDQIVIGPNGVFYIDRRDWAAHDSVQDTPGDNMRRDPATQMYRREYVLKDLLRRNHVQAPLIGLICVERIDNNGDHAVFRSVEHRRLQDYIVNHQGRRTLMPQEIDRISALIQQFSKPA